MEKKNSFAVSREELTALFDFRNTFKITNKFTLYVVGILLTPITLAGALIGFVRGYMKFMFPGREIPALTPLKPIVRVAMVIGAVLIWVVLLVAIRLFAWLWVDVFGWQPLIFAYYVLVNLVISLVVFFLFTKWQMRLVRFAQEARMFGSARFATKDDLKEYEGKPGFYIGGGYTFADKGHLLTCGGTRSGKGTNLVIPNLLGHGGYDGSWVVIDPKGENAAITARYQREAGREVVILNPWGLLEQNTGQAQSYNPLDILNHVESPHLVDDVQIIAEMIVPINEGDRNKFFTDSARSIVTGLLLHIVTTLEKDERSLTTLWNYARLAGDDWQNLIAAMRTNYTPVNGEVVQNAGSEILKLMQAGDECYGSIIATVLQATDFLKSPALQEALKTGFDPSKLSTGKYAVYVIIPADKLQSHSRWLRLVVTSMMRAVVRSPKNRVCFLLDEFAALGYISEIETALSTYAGYEITVWPIIQSLIQLQNHYKGWETFIGNTAVRQFLSVSDNFTANYVSAASGKTTNVIYEKKWFGIGESKTNQRDLITSDEVRRGSADNIFAFLGGQPVTYFNKMPYYNWTELKSRAENNPYHS